MHQLDSGKDAFVRLDAAPCNINALSALKPLWSDNSTDNYLSQGRTEDMLFYMLDGRRKYTVVDDASSFWVESGDILFLPAGSRYLTVCRCQPGQTGSGICIKFILADEKQQALRLGSRPFVIAHDQNDHFRLLFEKTLAAVLQGVGGRTRAKACVFSLLSDLIASVRASSFSQHAFAEIYPAIQIMEQRLQDNIPVADLAQLCHVSESVFRRRFKQYAKLPPHQYRNQLRVNKADELLETGLYTVERAAMALGFTDASHLCKVYRKFKGHSPRETAGTL